MRKSGNFEPSDLHRMQPNQECAENGNSREKSQQRQYKPHLSLDARHEVQQAWLTIAVDGRVVLPNRCLHDTPLFFKRTLNFQISHRALQGPQILLNHPLHNAGKINACHRDCTFQRVRIRVRRVVRRPGVRRRALVQHTAAKAVAARVPVPLVGGEVAHTGRTRRRHAKPVSPRPYPSRP